MDWKLDTIIDILKEIKNHTDHEDHEDEEGDYTNDYLILGVIYSRSIYDLIKSDNTLTNMAQSIAFILRSLRMVCMGDG